MTIRVAINGYGRIGRDLHRQLIGMEGIEVVAINSRADAESHAYLLKYDSLYGKCDAEIGVDGKDLVVNGKKIYVYQVDDLEKIGWGDKDIDIVVESTGKFTSEKDAEKHLRGGAKKVLITAPCNDLSIPNIVMGVNDKDYAAADYKVISNASCTTNCLAPVAYVLNQEFGIEAAFVTTVHAFTYTQNLLDNSNPEDFRRARATTESIIPTTTGAMKAIGRVIPELAGKMDGLSMRVPITTVSSIDMVAKLGKAVSAAEINEAFKKYEAGSMKGFLGTCTDPVVSVDFRGDSRSSIVDLPLTKTLPGGFVQVISWYDNEWGYVCRVVDLIKWFV
jgi:glyceraldehyde 3-phosphate dehydrogenase